MRLCHVGTAGEAKCRSDGDSDNSRAKRRAVGNNLNAIERMPPAGIEPARPFGHGILSPERLPFRHGGGEQSVSPVDRTGLSRVRHELEVRPVRGTLSVAWARRIPA